MNLKQQATSGFLWNAIDRFSAQIIQLVVTILLGRLLLPEIFGLIGMLSIFISISQTFVDSGMASGLIQKKDRTPVDYSTVFIFNLVISSLVYLILYFSAPFIADFYNEPSLIILTRVLSLSILIGAFSIVQRTRLNIELDFKSLTKVNLLAVFISSITAIILALLDYGVWALVAQQLMSVSVAVVLLWMLSKETLPLKFSLSSFRELFGFSSKILIQRVYGTIFQNIYNIALGKFYTAATLGYFTRAKSFTTMSSGIIADILQKVSYPLLSSIQDDKTRLISVYSRIIKMTAFITLPCMTVLALMADPIILILLGEEWTGAIVLLQWLALAQITYPIAAINMNILNVVGRSDLFLKIDLVKMPMTIISLIITIPIGVEAIVIGVFTTSYIAFFINAYLPGKLFGYGALKQLKDMQSYFIATLGMAIIVYASIIYISDLYAQLLVGVIMAGLSYWFFSALLKVKELDELKLLLSQFKAKLVNR